MKKAIKILVLVVCCLSMRAQHYTTLSQYIINGLAINPAYAGRNGVMDVTMAHRRQWLGFNGSPVTTSLMMNTPLRQKQIGLGLAVIDDKLGPYSNQYASVIYSYRVRVGRFKLSFGLQNGIAVSKVNYDNLQRNQQQDAIINGQRLVSTGFVSGAGVYLHNKQLFVGLSAPYLVNTLNSDFLKENPIILNGGYFIGLDRDHGLKPSVLVRYINHSPVSADINLNYYYKYQFGFGLSYRTNKSLVAITEFGINHQLRFCYSYDCELNRLKKYQNGSHEILIRYYFGYNINAKNPRTMFL
jgi:type IX secretion system PorP/SprF family membrane protein